ncbi:MAG: hypothetical protein RR048_04150 [Oscillospiraceae bacterium]
MITSRKPGVYSSYTVEKQSVTAFAQKSCGIVGKDETVLQPELKVFESIEEVKGYIGNDAAKEKFVFGCEMLFSMGVKKIYFAFAKDKATVGTALSLFEGIKDMGVVVADEQLGEFVGDFNAHCIAMSEKQKERFFVVGCENVAAAATKAKALNSQRAVVTAGKGIYKKGKVGYPFYLACLLSGICLSMKQPNESLSLVDSEVLFGLEINPTDDEISLGIENGVSVFEEQPHCVCLLKGLSTKVKTGDVTDRSFAPLTTVITVDYIMESIRNMLYLLIKSKKVSGISYDSISSQVCVLLSEFATRGLISSFEIPNIYPYSTDSSVCVIEVKFKLLPCVDTIHLKAEILV